MLFAELYSGSCKIPKKYRIYHAGNSVEGMLKADERETWGGLSNHIFFSASMENVQWNYQKDYDISMAEIDEDFAEDFKEREPRELYVMDARLPISNSYVMSNLNGPWYDELRLLGYFLRGFNKFKVDSIIDLQKCDLGDMDGGICPEEYLDEFPNLKTRGNIEQRFIEHKIEWFLKYCKPFNFLKMERYRKQRDNNTILVPGPIGIGYL